MPFFNCTPKIAVTGGSGFLGQHLLKHEAFQDALAIGRTKPKNHPHFFKVSFEDNVCLADALNNVDILVHAAGRAHVMDDKSKSPLDHFRKVNAVMTLNLAKQAAIAGVKRFVFISTIKVLGEQTEPGKAFQNHDNFNPQDPYSISKAEAEEGLKLIGDFHDMEIVIIRPPLVYGKGVKGNFASLLKLAKLTVPLPFGSIQNKRSLVSVDNLVDFIVVCLDNPNASNETFLVSDDDDMSLSILFSRLAVAGGYKAFIIRFPPILLSIFLKMFGMSAIYFRLCGSMQVNIDYTKSKLGWKPPFKTQDSLRSCWSEDTLK